MAGQITVTRIPPATVPGRQSTVEELIAEYPELETELMQTVAWRDVGNPDRRSRNFERMYPTLRPTL